MKRLKDFLAEAAPAWQRKEGKATGARHYKNIQSKHMGEKVQPIEEDKMDKQIIHHATSGMKPLHIAKKLNIPTEWVHQTLKHHKSGDSGVDFNDPRNKPRSQRFGEEVELDEVAAWQRKEGKSESGGLNRKGIESYRRENPGSKLSMAVTTKPSKLKPGSKAANRRKSFCARMGGMKKRLTSAKTARDPDSRINKALRKWNC